MVFACKIKQKCQQNDKIMENSKKTATTREAVSLKKIFIIK